MKKNKGMAYAVLAIAFILFNVIAFVVPTAKTATFWVTYAFSAIAFASQIAILKHSFKVAYTLNSKFLGVPLILVGITYLIVQIIVFAIFVALPLTASWITVVVCIPILGISTICLIGTETGREEIKRVEEKAEEKVFYIKALQADIDMLASTEADAAIKMSLAQLAEKICYSDPMSNELTADLEEKITMKIAELKSSADRVKIIKELNSLLDERNKKIRILK